VLEQLLEHFDTLIKVYTMDVSFFSTKFFMTWILLLILHFTPCTVLEQLLEHFDTLTKEEDGRKVKIKVKVSTKNTIQKSECGEAPSEPEEDPSQSRK
jgi:hypothetical protein